MIEITKDLLLQVSNRTTKPETLLELVGAFNEFFPVYDIDQPLRIAAFVSQVSHETNQFNNFIEMGSVNYFRRYDPDTSIGRSLGNTIPGDGYRFRGRGPIQISGRENYKRYGNLLGIDLIDNPDLAADLKIGSHISCEYWNQKKLSDLADKRLFALITRKINGGLNHLKEREALYSRLCNYLKIPSQIS